MIGSLFILFFYINPVKGFLIFGVLNAIFGLLLFVPRYISIVILRDLIVIISLFGQAFLLSGLAFTQIIFSKYFN
jgi:hypothetical protein